MKTLTSAFAAAFATLTLAGAAAAQDAPVETEFTFEDDLVDGNPVGPDIFRLTVPIRQGHRTLVDPRAHFVPELMESVESL